MILFLLVACQKIQVIPLNFDGPVAGAVLPTGSTPFVDPVGFIANSRSGTIVPLNLKENRLLVDDPMASFVRSGALPTGDQRILADIAATVQNNAITLWAIDSRDRALLQVPYTTGVDEAGNPLEVEPTVSEPVFVDADSSGDSVSLADLTVRAGYTTTEDWSIHFDGSRWWATGAQSGTQLKEVIPGELWRSDKGELEFTLTGVASAGDRVELHTDTGIARWTFGQEDALITAVLAMPPGSSPARLYASVVGGLPGAPEGTLTDSQVIYLDVSGETPVYGGAVVLPAGASPGKMALASDGRLFVADTGLPLVYAISWTENGPVQSTLATRAPVVDLAWVSGLSAEGDAFEHLFIACLNTQAVDIWDLQGSVWHDPNPDTADTDGIPLGAPISGLAASVDTVWLQQENSFGAIPRIPVVLAATQDGLAHPLEASTGCEVKTIEGPHGPTPYTNVQDDFIVLEDQGETSSTIFWLDEESGYQVVTSPCGGITRSEEWTVTFDAATQSYEVEGSFSGVQQNRAKEDLRYISDTGAVSFLILAGTLPTTDGDRFSFITDAGVAVILGTDANEDGDVDRPWELPARPVAFDYLSGPTGGGWDPVYRQEFVLLPVQNSDIAAKIQLDSAYSSIYWD